MPTLLESNKIIPQPWYKLQEKKAAHDQPAIDFIIEQIEDRLTINNIPAKVKMTGPGSKVLVIRAKTGSGKSTILPTTLYNTFYEKLHKNILITEPTRVTTMEIPYDIAKWNKNITLGNNIGYQTGLTSRKPTKGILFCTVGILLQYLKSLTDDQICGRFSFIVIDEVHLRSIELDMVLFYLKGFLERTWEKKNCPMIILTSGTFEPSFYMKYFDCPKDNFIDVAGFSHPIKDHFAEFDVSNYMSYTAELIEKIHTDSIGDNTKLGDILVFVQGSSQIKQLIMHVHLINNYIYKNGMEKLKKKVTGGKELKFLLPIALMSENISKGSIEYIQIFSPMETLTTTVYQIKESKVGLGELGKELGEYPVARRVLIGTNAVETGITLSSIGHVIDTGYLKDMQFNPIFNCSILLDKNITQANSIQRRGRVGRNAPGNFYACYTKATFDAMDPQPFPEIIKENPTMYLLNIIIQFTKTTIVEIDFNKRTEKSFQKNQFDQNWYELQHETEFNIKELDLPQPLSADSISGGLEILHGLGFITHEYLPTLFGFYATKFRKVKYENIRMILAGYHHGANILDLITITSFLQNRIELGIKRHKYEPINFFGYNKNQNDYLYYNIIRDEFVEYLFIWNEFISLFDKFGKSKKSVEYHQIMDKLEEWCEKVHIQLNGLIRVIELRDEIIGDMVLMGLNPYYNGLKLTKGTYNLNNILHQNLAEGMEEIRKIKNCIYEGYRFNVCNVNAKGQYINHWQLPVNISSQIIEKNEIQQLVVSDVVLRESMFKKGTYQFIAGDISIMDNFVDVDMGFLAH